MRTILERPPLLEEGTYWIGKFEIEVKDNDLNIFPRQDFSHKHQETDTMFISHFSNRSCRIFLKGQKDSLEAEKRIGEILHSRGWKPRKFKTR
jgi:hypothetical protein